MSRLIAGIYAYYDNVSQSLIQPILGVQATDEAAIRDFEAMLSHPKFQEGRQIGDYDLVRVGSFDVMENRICQMADDPCGRPLLKGTSVRAKLESAARLLPEKEV